MDQELIDYIINHYSVLLSLEEKLAQKHLFATDKTESVKSQALKDKIMRDLGTEDKGVLQLLDRGYEEFKRGAAEKILKEYSGEVFINRCLKCGRLARTPYAKQCRHCGYDWH